MDKVIEALRRQAEAYRGELQMEGEVFHLLSAACSECCSECCSGNGSCPPPKQIQA